MIIFIRLYIIIIIIFLLSYIYNYFLLFIGILLTYSGFNLNSR